MTKVLVYGDSFADDACTIGNSWTSLLSKKLNVPQVNRAVSGGSSQYAMKSFLNDYHSNFIDYKDIVIFVLSTPGRMHFEFQNSRPDTASKYLHGSTDEWYKNNKKFIEWWMLNIDVSIENINHDCYIHALKTFAELRPETKVILLANLDHDPSGKNKLPLGNIPSNFFKPNILLNEISENEIVGKLKYNEWTRVTGYDPRINHLSNPNLDILSDKIFEIINTNSIDNVKYEHFKSNIFELITTKHQYLKYIHQRLLYRDNTIYGTING